MHIIGVQGGATDFTPGVDNFTIFDSRGPHSPEHPGALLE